MHASSLYCCSTLAQDSIAGDVSNQYVSACCRALSQRWNMPLELAHDLATLALYDIVIFADDSGSMIFEEGGERINDLKLILGRVAEVATLFDEDGEQLSLVSFDIVSHVLMSCSCLHSALQGALYAYNELAHLLSRAHSCDIRLLQLKVRPTISTCLVLPALLLTLAICMPACRL